MVFKGLTGYLYGTDELNKVCSVYGNGKGATGGRSITYDDIAKVIGLTKWKNTSEYTYTWTSESNSKKAPTYDAAKTKYLSYYHVKRDETTLQPGTMGVFNYYYTQTGKWETNTQELNGLQNDVKIGTINPDYVGYGSVSENAKATRGYSVVFKTDSGEEIKQNTYDSNGNYVSGDSNRYWLGSSCCSANSNYAYWGMYYVYASGSVSGSGMYNSFGYVRTPGCGVRPVVSLKSDIQLTASTTAENTYDIK